MKFLLDGETTNFHIKKVSKLEGITSRFYQDGHRDFLEGVLSLKQLNVGPDRFEVVSMNEGVNKALLHVNPTEQLQSLFAVMDPPHKTAAAMMILALFTGMRRDELFKLRWEDLDFHRGFISIVAPKGGKSQKIPMNKNAEEVCQPAENERICVPLPNRRSSDGYFKRSPRDQGSCGTASRLPTTSWFTTCICHHACEFRQSRYVYTSEADDSQESSNDPAI